jgi:nucleoside-diphosphate-sugar epimerase
LYAEQKVAAFNKAKEVLRGTEVRFTWARIFYPYGPNQDQKRLIPSLIDSLRNGKSIQLADVSSVHDWVTTKDIASAISWTMENKLPEEVDIGTSLGFTNLELFNCIKELLNERSLPPIDDRHEIGLGEVFVAGKNSPLFISGWLPEYSLRSGLEWVLSS